MQSVVAHVCCTGDSGLQTRGSLLLRKGYRPGFPRALGCSPRRRVSLPCLAQARTFQPDSGSGAGEQRQEVVSHALATAVEAPLAQPAPLRLHEPPSVEEQLRQLQKLSQMLWAANTYEDKVKVLERYSPVVDFLNTREGKAISARLDGLTPLEGYVLLCLPAIGQEHVLTLLPTGVDVAAALRQLADALCGVEHFYDSIGGLVGYQRQCLQLICQQRQAIAAQQAEQAQHSMGASTPAGSAQRATTTQFLVPEGINLADPGHSAHAAAASLAGLEALPALAEIYPLGGAGDRLGLRCEVTGECLPTAVLQYCGKSLLEVLVRDLQAREYLHWRVHGTQQTTPVAIMTSAAKGNHWRVEAAFEEAGWFGRGRESFRLFQQPLVPMVAGEDGRWLLTAPLQPLLKPGGHGVIWKLMLDSGVFDWLRSQGREAAIVRQISNPMAGMDNTLLALAGSGHSGGHSFGFASCERAVGASEGINVLVQQHVPSRRKGEPGRFEYRVTNVEYTEFERLGFADEQAADGSNLSKFPANTNVLYVGLQAAEGLVRDSVARGTTDAILPGMILNLKKKVSFFDAWLGRERSVPAGRLECTMQNLADLLVTRSSRALEGCERQLDTFVLYNQRRKVTSSAKRKLKPGSDQIHQTPDGSFYTLQQNARDLLLRCGFDVPEVGAVPDYLSRGPGFLFLFHPALGPLWDVVAQKLRGGCLAPRSELVLEVAEADVEGLHLQGSLLVHADCVMGRLEVHAGAPIAGSPQAGEQHGAAHPPAASKAVRKVHNGVEHRPTSSGAYGSVSLAQPVDTTSGSEHSNSVAAAAEAAAGAAARAEPRLVYSDRCGRVRLRNVRVQNRGVDWEHPDNIYWRHKVARHESARIVLRGRSEFEAHDVTLAGDLLFEVPDGYLMTVTAGAAGEPVVQLAALGPHPSWSWSYTVAVPQSGSEGSSGGGRGSAGGVVLELVEASSSRSCPARLS